MNEERQQQQLDKMIERLFELQPEFRDYPLEHLRYWLRRANFDRDQIYAICIISRSIAENLLKKHLEMCHNENENNQVQRDDP